MILSFGKLKKDQTEWLIAGDANWSDSVIEEYEYKTDIITSELGREQRRAVRLEPRRKITFTGLFHAKSKLYMEYYMANGLAQPTILPEPHLFVTLTEPITPIKRVSGFIYRDAVLNKKGFPYWLRQGQRVVLNYGDQWETRTILNLYKNSIEFKEELIENPLAGQPLDPAKPDGPKQPEMINDGSNFPAGTKVYRASVGRLQNSPKADRLTPDVYTMGLEFSISPDDFYQTYSLDGASVNEDFDTQPKFDIVAGREVLAKKHNWAETQDFSYQDDETAVDYEFGKIAYFRKTQFPSRTVSLSYLLKGHNQIRQFVEFFARCKGKQKEILVPTYEQDVPFQYIVGNGKSIVMDGVSFGLAYKNSKIHKRLLLQMNDGRSFHYKIDLIDALPQTNSSVIQTIENLPDELLTPTTINRISWVFVARMASDALQLEWLTTDVATFKLSYVVLENRDL